MIGVKRKLTGINIEATVVLAFVIIAVVMVGSRIPWVLLIKFHMKVINWIFKWIITMTSLTPWTDLEKKKLAINDSTLSLVNKLQIVNDKNMKKPTKCLEKFITKKRSVYINTYTIKTAKCCRIHDLYIIKW